MRQLGPMLADQSNMQSLTAACPATFHPIHVGVAAKAIPGLLPPPLRPTLHPHPLCTRVPC
eukprot:2017396-Rhodomonas_salina.1